MRTPVIIESPFAGCVPLHKAYLGACIRDALARGETPYTSHRMLTDALDDLRPEERELGISAGLDMAEIIIGAGGIQAFYTDLGWSGGMNRALGRAFPRTATRTIGESAEVWTRIFCEARDDGEEGEAWGTQDTSALGHIATTKDLCCALKRAWEQRNV
jgi:hypothetical protein